MITKIDRFKSLTWLTFYFQIVFRLFILGRFNSSFGFFWCFKLFDKYVDFFWNYLLYRFVSLLQHSHAFWSWRFGFYIIFVVWFYVLVDLWHFFFELYLFGRFDITVLAFIAFFEDRASVSHLYFATVLYLFRHFFNQFFQI